MPGAEFAGELADALGAVLRHKDRHFAQPMRPWGSRRGPALAHQRIPEGASADETRHQSSRLAKGIDTARRSRQCAVYASAQAAQELLLRMDAQNSLLKFIRR